MAPQNTVDPYESIATPIPASATPASGSDPYVSIATPIPPDQSKAGFLGGALKPVAESVAGIGNMIGRGAEIMLGEPKGSLTATEVHPQPLSGTGELGDVAGNTAEWMAGEEGLKALGSIAGTASELANASKFIHSPAAWAEYLKESPKAAWLLKAIGSVGKGAVTGAVVGGTQGAATGNASSGATRGAELGAAAGAVEPAISAVKSAVKVTPKNPWASARTIIRNATRSPEAEGAAVEQPLAQAGIKANAPTVGASFRSGIDVDTPFKEAKTLYKAVDDATGTKFQDLYEKLDAAKDAERVAPSGSPEEARASQTVKNQEDFINDMRERAKSAGVNVDRTLAAADKKFAEAQANKEFNNKFFGNQGILKGNATQGAPETVNVQKAIDTLESMDKPNKYGLSRLQQTSLGKNGVAALKQSLYDAQKAGQAAMDARQFRNTILKFAGIGGGALAGTYELTK